MATGEQQRENGLGGGSVERPRAQRLLEHHRYQEMASRVVQKIEGGQQAEGELNNSFRLHPLTSLLLEVQERERRRLAKELHDELGQALLLIKLQLNEFVGKLRQNQTRLKTDCRSIMAYLDSVIDNVRRLSQDLSPAPLEELGLSSGLRYLYEICTNLFQLKDATVEIDDLDCCFSLQAQINIYRICQESLTNIGKHAQANHLSLVAKDQGDRVVFQLQDNGKGFDLTEVLAREPYRRGLGLAAMEERVKLLGGTFGVRSQFGAGTKISFTIPKDLEG